MKGKQVRSVVVTVDTLVEVLKDYLGEENLPADAQAVRLLVNRKEQGKVGLVVASEQLATGLPALQAHFDIRRVYSVGGQE